MRVKEKSCFFVGYSETSAALLPELQAEVERHIAEYGVKEFFVGHYGGFDALAAQAVIAAKRKFSGVRLFLLLPYHPAERPIQTPEGFDGMFYPFGAEKVPRRAAIVRANRLAVEQVNYLIAYVQHPASNAKKIFEYAQRRERKGLIAVTNLAGK